MLNCNFTSNGISFSIIIQSRLHDIRSVTVHMVAIKPMYVMWSNRSGPICTWTWIVACNVHCWFCVYGVLKTVMVMLHCFWCISFIFTIEPSHTDESCLIFHLWPFLSLFISCVFCFFFFGILECSFTACRAFNYAVDLKYTHMWNYHYGKRNVLRFDNMHSLAFYALETTFICSFTCSLRLCRSVCHAVKRAANRRARIKTAHSKNGGHKKKSHKK